jgi:hypothetical protein
MEDNGLDNKDVEVADEASVKKDKKFSKKNPLEKAIAKAYDIAKKSGDMCRTRDINHPYYYDTIENPDDRDLSKDYCPICKTYRVIKYDKSMHLMCCRVKNKETNHKTMGCGLWFHPKCVGLSEVPNGHWACQDCSEEFFDPKVRITIAGMTFEPDTKESAKKNTQSEDQVLEKKRYSMRKRKQVLPSSRSAHKSDYIHFGDVMGITTKKGSLDKKASKRATRSTTTGSSTKEKKTYKKRKGTGAPKKDLDSDSEWEKEKSSGSDSENSDTEDFVEPVAKKAELNGAKKAKLNGASKKTVAGATKIVQGGTKNKVEGDPAIECELLLVPHKNRLPPRQANTRLANTEPKTRTQTLDTKVRSQVDQLQDEIEKLQNMTIKPTLRDDYVKGSKPGQEQEEATWPLNAPGLFFMTGQKPNLNSTGYSGRLDKETLYLWCGSEAICNYAKERLESGDMKIVLTNSHQGFKSVVEMKEQKTGPKTDGAQRGPKTKEEKKRIAEALNLLNALEATIGEDVSGKKVTKDRAEKALALLKQQEEWEAKKQAEKEAKKQAEEAAANGST